MLLRVPPEVENWPGGVSQILSSPWTTHLFSVSDEPTVCLGIFPMPSFMICNLPCEFVHLSTMTVEFFPGLIIRFTKVRDLVLVSGQFLSHCYELVSLDQRGTHVFESVHQLSVISTHLLEGLIGSIELCSKLQLFAAQIFN